MLYLPVFQSSPVHTSLSPDSTSLLNGCISTPYITSEHDRLLHSIDCINTTSYILTLGRIISGAMCRCPTQCPRVSSKFLSKFKVGQLRLSIVLTINCLMWSIIIAFILYSIPCDLYNISCLKSMCVFKWIIYNDVIRHGVIAV